MLYLFALFLSAQATGDVAYQTMRQKASDLFSQGKRLEALPLLEELVKANPKDDQMLVALAACLVDHAATLSDQDAAGKERLRARDLLEQAWKLGNYSKLALNLSEILKRLPESGAIKFSDNAQVEKAMEAGEAAFSSRNFDEAVKDYSKALELDHKNYMAALFIGNAYDRQTQFSLGAEWYERAIQIDPDIETAYRYYADMLAKEGDMSKSRTMLIHAAVAEPYNQIVWRELQAWATLNHTHINEILVAVPGPIEDQPKGFQQPREISDVWQAYRGVSAKWKQGDEFKKHFPDETDYRHSLPEEAEALTAAAIVAEKLAQDKKTAGLVAKDPNINRLFKLYEANLIEAYVLFSLGDQGIAKDYKPYREKNRAKLEAYLDKFVVPATGSQISAASSFSGAAVSVARYVSGIEIRKSNTFDDLTNPWSDTDRADSVEFEARVAGGHEPAARVIEYL
jgi:tetratricopeptide (TPR) repeat protein